MSNFTCFSQLIWKLEQSPHTLQPVLQPDLLFLSGQTDDIEYCQAVVQRSFVEEIIARSYSVNCVRKNSNQASGARLGELLVETGWLTATDIEDALSVASETDQPLGHVLIVRGKLTAKEVRALILAQSLLRDQYITPTDARQALTISSWSGLSLEDSLLVFLGRDIDANSPYCHRLGQLLIASGCVDAKTIEHTLTYCHKVGLPLGRALIMRKHITKSVLHAALEAQRLVRANAVAIEQAISGLADIKRGADGAQSSKSEDLHLGSLLVQSGVLEPIHLSAALEASKAECKPLGQVLLSLSLISAPLLETALELQQLLRKQRLRPRRAIKALSICHATNMSVQEALASITDAPGTGIDISIALFLKHTGLFQHRLSELDSIDHSGLGNRDQLQFLSGFINAEQLVPAVRCTFLVRYSIVSFEQALLAYHYSQLSGKDIDAFLTEVGWVEVEALAMLVNLRVERHLTAVAA